MNQKPHDSKMVADYVIAIRSRGAFLAYSDYAIIESWLSRAENVEKLLLILDDILPITFSKIPDSGPPPSLKMVDKRVHKALAARQNLRARR